MAEIIEHFPDGGPQLPVRRAVERFLEATAEGHLAGLGRVVLTNSTELPSSLKKRSRRRTKEGTWIVLGRYYRPWKGETARIELYANHILRGYPSWLLRIPFILDLAVGRAFFHELGHHKHQMHRPEHRDEEAVAEDWSETLRNEYFRRRYWYVRLLRLAFYPLHVLLRFRRRPKRREAA